MNYFIFNNKNSFEDMKIGIIGNSIRVKPKEKIEKEEIEGRKLGSLVYKTGNYEDIILSRKLRLLTFEDYEEETFKIVNWFTNIEDNRLIFKDYPQKCYKVKYVEFGDFEDYRGGNVDFEVKFICEPFIYSSIDEEIEVTNRELILNDGFLPAEPLITLELPSTTQTISITIGAKTIQLDNVKGNVIIDSQTPRVICEGVEIKTIGDFPVLTEGYNIISWVGNINKFTMKKNLLYRG